VVLAGCGGSPKLDDEAVGVARQFGAAVYLDHDCAAARRVERKGVSPAACRQLLTGAPLGTLRLGGATVEDRCKAPTGSKARPCVRLAIDRAGCTVVALDVFLDRVAGDWRVADVAQSRNGPRCGA
jgi:hypothetical protein